MGQSRRISRLWDVKLKGHKRRPGNEAEEVGPCPCVCASYSCEFLYTSFPRTN